MKIRNLIITIACLITNLTTASLALAQQNKVVVIPLGGSEARLVTTSVTQNYLPGQFNGTFSGDNYFRNTGHDVSFTNNSAVNSLGLNVPINLPQGAAIT